MGFHGGAVGRNLTIAKVHRSACSLVCAGAGIMRVRARGARSGVGRKRKERPRGKESQPWHSVWRVGLVSSVAKRFGPVCGGVLAAEGVRACGQIRHGPAQQVSLGTAKKVNGSVRAQRASLVGQRTRRRRTLARKPGCHRLPPGCCPGPGLHPPLG